MIVLRRVAGVYRQPGHIRAPQTQGAGPGCDVVAGPDGALGFLRQAQGEQAVGDAAGQLTHLIVGVGATVLDVG